MRKLKLESLQVESFVTAAALSPRGTINAHSDPQPTPPTETVLQTYDVEICGETQYFDCSLGCPSIGPCQLTEYDCA